MRASELTARAVLTGMLIGAALTPCNVYSGLKIGWSFNMSIAAGLLGLGFWTAWGKIIRTRPFALLENNVNQTAASSAANIVSAGLVAPIPALTILTGTALGPMALVPWVFAVSLLGVIVAIGLRRQMIVEEKLAFPAGLATAETMTEVHRAGSNGKEAARRLVSLFTAATLSAGVKLVNDLVLVLPRLAPPVTLPALGVMRTAAPGGTSFFNLGLSFDPSLLMIGFGAMIGMRAGLSLLLGATLAWGILAPVALARGWAEPGAPNGIWFETLVTWLLWPGATLIVVASLVSFAISLARVYGSALPRRQPMGRGFGWGYVALLALTTVLIIIAARMIFGIGIFPALLAVALSFILAIVAARVTGETSVTPIGALGKITQLTFGVVTPGDLTANLMTANITGGAAGQCADLMQDLKTGYLIGAQPRAQYVAQFCGVAVGSLAGAFTYLLLVPDPAGMLITPEWPAPAVATWKAVAEVLAEGLSAIPRGAVPAMGIATLAGILLALAERLLPQRIARWLPSAPAIGLAFVVPAWNAISLFLGAAGAAALKRAAPRWADQHGLALAAGLVAGESLAGVAVATASLLG